MNKKTLAWLLGACLVGGSAAGGILACSSDGDGDLPSDDNGQDSGGGSDATTGTDGGRGDGGGTGDGGTRTDGGDGGTGTCPDNLQLRPSDGGVFCPFANTNLPDGSPFAITCDIGQHCCVYPFNSSQPSSNQASDCQTTCPTFDAGGSDYECDEAQDCPSGNICCVNANPPDLDNEFCSRVRVLKTTRCRTSCQAGEFQACQTQAECASGFTCTPTKYPGKQVGVCIQ